MTDPFLISGPAVISFSGGRTSAYMLRRILNAHGGTLPPDVLVCFANTGREMPATLDFVQACGAAWGVHIHWLEYRWQPGAHGYEVVSHNSAARDGEPFLAVIKARSYLPNPIARFCTAELKIRTMSRYVRDLMGWKTWLNVIGLRADEQRRVLKSIDPVKWKKDGYETRCPLNPAGITSADVMAFWAAQPFDLMLAGKWEGNCDGCFLKSKASIQRMWLEHPERMQWWADVECNSSASGTMTKTGALFRKDRADFATLGRDVRSNPRMNLFDETMVEGGEDCDGGCGV